MGCACKANQQITYLQKKYGDNIPQSKMSNIRGMVSVNLKTLLVFLILIPIMPIFLVYFIVKHLVKKEKAIDINKTFKIVT